MGSTGEAGAKRVCEASAPLGMGPGGCTYPGWTDPHSLDLRPPARLPPWQQSGRVPCSRPPPPHVSLPFLPPRSPLDNIKALNPLGGSLSLAARQLRAIGFIRCFDELKCLDRARGGRAGAPLHRARSARGCSGRDWGEVRPGRSRLRAPCLPARKTSHASLHGPAANARLIVPALCRATPGGRDRAGTRGALAWVLPAAPLAAAGLTWISVRRRAREGQAFPSPCLRPCHPRADRLVTSCHPGDVRARSRLARAALGMAQA